MPSTEITPLRYTSPEQVQLMHSIFVQVLTEDKDDWILKVNGIRITFQVFF